MTPSQLKALLDAAATPRPVDESITIYPNRLDKNAIVATMNAADALVALWEAARKAHEHDNVGFLNEALRRLEEL